MANEDDLRRDVNRAQRAQALINDELLAEAFTKLQNEYREVWEQSPATATAVREKAYLALKMLPVLRSSLEAMIMDGSVARKQLTNLEEDRARFKRKVV